MVNSQMRDVQHNDPVWRDRSNFVIAAEIDVGSDSHVEQLFARQVGPHSFEICCIPFFLYDIALGDVVETDADYLVRRVVERSGRYVFRVWFGESAHPRDDEADTLAELGALLEWSSVNLLAVDARDGDHAQEIANHLEVAADGGRLVFDTGRSG